MKSSKFCRFATIIFCLLLSTGGHGQSLLDSLIATNHFTFKIDKDSLSGPAITVLKKQLKNVQFVLIGENHNTAEIPDFTAKLFAVLRKDFGYRYAALEQDPITMRKSAKDKNGISLSSMKSMLRKYPNSFTFHGDQELEMIHSIIQMSKTKNSVWGCDQAFGTASAIRELLNYKNNKTVDSLYALAYGTDSVRNSTDRFITQAGNLSTFKILRNIYGEDKNEYVRFITYSLLKSNSIYSQFLRNNKYQSRLEREQYMKERFAEEYKNARVFEPFPKVLLKFGNAHLIYGFNEGSSVISLGTFVSELAKYNDKEALSLNTLILRKDGSAWDLSTYPTAAHLSFFTKHCDTTVSHLIDMRPLRSYFYKGSLKEEVKGKLENDFEKLIFGFDFLVFIANGRTADFTVRK